MAFNINAQVILSGPKNLGKISKQIQTSLGKSGAIKVKIDPNSLRNIKILNSTIGTLNTNIASLNSSASKLQSTLNGVNSRLSKASSATSSFSKSQSNTASSIKNVNNALQQQNQQLGNLGKRFLSTAKTAIAFGLISRPIYDLQRAFIGATKDAVAFEREIVKISQVTGQTVKQLGNLRSDINRLSTSLGVSANELAETARIIAQTGQTAENTRVILEALSRSTLAPTFGSITDTTEGLVAALGQFNLDAKDSEAILGALNRVSKNFAVEAEDLISVIRRTGGVFAQAAGDSRNTIGALEELIAIFTAVRSTTRESADTIAAGLRTIFSRIQRRGTIEFLEQFNIQLTNAKGQFIGVFPAFDELSRKLDTLIRQGDALTLSAIAEELGGIRQIGKLLPAIAQFDKARAALEEAQKGATEGLSGDVSKALDTIDSRLKRVRESFNELIRTVFESPAFQTFAKTILTVSEQFLKFSTTIVKFIEPILPLIAGLGAIKLGNIAAGAISGGGLGGLASAASTVTGQATATNTAQVAAAAQQSVSIEQQMLSVLSQMSNQLSNIFSLQSADNKLRNGQLSNLIQINQSGFNQVATAQRASGATPAFAGVRRPRRRASGGQIYGFNRGGMVPGTGNRDTVPAMLTPGEFVIKKSSVESIGADQLSSMNKYAKGGKIIVKPGSIGGFFLSPEATDPASLQIPKGKTITISNQKVLDQLGRGLSGDDARIRDSLLGAGSKKRQERILFGRGSGKLREKLTPQSFTKTGTLRANIGEPEANAALAKGSKRRGRIKGLQKRGLATQPQQVPIEGSIVGYFPGGSDVRKNQKIAQVVNKFTKKGLEDAIVSASTEINSLFDVGALNFDESKLKNAAVRLASDPNAVSTTEGFAFEGIIQGLTGATLAGNQSNFDFPSSSIGGARDKLANFFTSGMEGIASLIKGDAKRSNTPKALSSIVNKINNDINKGILEGVQIVAKASGGSISGQDTVPALLTPGEFVFSKKSASRIGYGNLNRMNKDGVQGFNKGGTVGVRKYNTGTGPTGVTAAVSGAASGMGQLVGQLFALQAITANLSTVFSENATASERLTAAFFTLISVVGSAQIFSQTFQTLKGLGTNFKTLSGNIKNLPKTLKGFGNSFKTLRQGIKGVSQGKTSLSGFGRSFAKNGNKIGGAVGKLNSKLGRGVVQVGKFSNFLGKQAAGKGIGAAVSKGLLRLGPSLGGAIAGPLAAAASAALVAIPIGKVIGDTVGSSLDKAIFGAREEAGGFQGREGQSAAGAAASGAVREGLAGAGIGAGAGAAIGSVVPVIGTALGAAIGAASGLIGGAIVGAINGPLEQASFEAAKKIQASQEEVGKSLEAFTKSGSLSDYDAFINDFLAQGDAQNEAFDTFTNQFENSTSLLDFAGLGVISDTFNSFGKLLQGDLAGAAKSIPMSRTVGRVGQVAGTALGEIGDINIGKSIDDAFKRANPIEGTRLQEIINQQFGTISFEDVGNKLSGAFNDVNSAIVDGAKNLGDGITVAANSTFKSFTGVDFSEAQGIVTDGINRATTRFGQSIQRVYEQSPLALAQYLLGPAEAAQEDAEEQQRLLQEKSDEEQRAIGKSVEVSKKSLQATQRLNALLDPAQVEKAGQALNLGLQKLVEAGDIDISGIEGEVTAEKIDNTLREQADAGNVKAQQQLAAKTKQYNDQIGVSIGKLKKDADSKGVATALAKYQTAVREGTIDPDNQQQVEGFFSKFGEGADSVGEAALGVVDGIKKQGDAATVAAVNTALLNTALREANAALDLFVSDLKTIQNNLAVAITETDNSLANLDATTQALSEGQVLALSSVSGFGLGKAGGDLRQERISAIGQATGQDVSAIQKFDTVITNADDIGKEAFKTLTEGRDPTTGTASLKDVQDALVDQIEGELGFELPEGPLKDGVVKSLEAFGRQLGNGSDIPLDQLKQAIEDGKVEEIFGEAFAEIQATSQALSDAFDKLQEVATKEAQLRQQISQLELEAAQEQLKRQRAIDDFQIDPEAVDTRDQRGLAQTRQQEDLALLGFGDGQDASQIAKAQDASRKEQEDLAKQFQSGALTAKEYAEQQAAAAQKTRNASAALDLLANDTRQLAAVQAEAQKLIQRRAEGRELGGKIVEANLTGDVSTQARIEESRRIAQSAIGPGASKEAQQQAFLQARQDPEFKRIFAVQARSQLGEAGEGLTTDQIFDQVQVQNLRAQADQARAGGETERADFLDQLATDIEAPGLEDLQKEAVKIQTDQLAVQKIIAAQQSALVKAQLEQLGVTRDKLDTVIATETQNLNEQLAAQNQAAQEEQAATQTLEQTAITAGAAVGGGAAGGVAGGVITPGNLASLPLDALSNISALLSPGASVANNDGFLTSQLEPLLKEVSGPSPQQQSQQGIENFAAILQEGLVAFVEKVDLIQAAAELQNQASERQLEAANGMPTQIAHNMAPVEINGFADLPRALNEFTNNIGEIAQSMIDPSQKYQGPPDQGGGTDDRTLG